MSHRSGTTHGYQPQWKNGEKWENIEVKHLHGNAETPARGFHFPLYDGGILQEIWLCGREQAWAIAWGYACEIASISFSTIEVRIQEFKVTYSIDYEPINAESTGNDEP